MKPILCYRVENSEGVGPYSIADLFNAKHSYLNGRPGPHNDSNTFNHKFRSLSVEHGYNNIVFGFVSLRKLQIWFDKEDRTLLHDEGLHIGVYEVTEYAKSRRQMVFNKATAKLVETLPIV